MLYRVKGALLIGIALVTVVSWPRGTPFTAFPHDAIGDANFDFFKKVATFHPLEKINNALDVSLFLLIYVFQLAYLSYSITTGLAGSGSRS